MATATLNEPTLIVQNCRLFVAEEQPGQLLAGLVPFLNS